MYNIHIDESSLMTKSEFLDVLYSQERTEDYIMVMENRSKFSILCEWAAHKMLYVFHILRDHTESVDLNYPQKWYEKIAYFLVGGISLLFFW